MITTTYICIHCSNVVSFEESDEVGFVISWVCGNCGHRNNVADMNQPIVSLKMTGVC